MICPYCGRKTNDIPTHLSKNKKCHDKHKDNLKIQLIYLSTKKAQ